MILTDLKPFSWATRRYSSTTAFTSRGGIVCRSKTSVISISTGSGNGLSRSMSLINLTLRTALLISAFMITARHAVAEEVNKHQTAPVTVEVNDGDLTL